jgi:hypothetical protein
MEQCRDFVLEVLVSLWPMILAIGKAEVRVEVFLHMSKLSNTVVHHFKE